MKVKKTNTHKPITSSLRTEPFIENPNKTKALNLFGTNKPLNHGLTVQFGLS